MGRFLKFEKMITPLFIQLIFWIGTILIVLAGIMTMVGGFFADSQLGEAMNLGPGGKIAGFVMGLLIIVIGPVILRIYCEMLIVIFKLQGAMIQTRDLLKEQNQLLGRIGHQPPPPPPPPAPQTRQRQSPPSTRQTEAPTRREQLPKNQGQQSNQSGSDIPPEFLE